MHPTTLIGWYNTIVRGYPYNEKTAYILDYTLKPSPRFLSTLADRRPGPGSRLSRWERRTFKREVNLNIPAAQVRE